MAKAAVQFDDVVPFSQFLDGVMDLPVARALYATAQKTVVIPAVSLFFNDKFQQSRVRVEGPSATIHLLHARHPCCATATRPQCKLCSRLQRSHRCVCSSWLGLTCPLLRNGCRRGAGSACSSGVPQLLCSGGGNRVWLGAAGGGCLL